MEITGPNCSHKLRTACTYFSLCGHLSRSQNEIRTDLLIDCGVKFTGQCKLSPCLQQPLSMEEMVFWTQFSILVLSDLFHLGELEFKTLTD